MKTERREGQRRRETRGREDRRAGIGFPDGAPIPAPLEGPNHYKSIEMRKDGTGQITLHDIKETKDNITARFPTVEWSHVSSASAHPFWSGTIKITHDFTLKLFLDD
jgi:hypothetical protein